MTRTAPFPAAPDQVTPTWLTSVLRAAGVLGEATVAAVDWTPIGEEQGFTGVVARLGLRYGGEEPTDTAPPTLVAKFPTALRPTPSAYRTLLTDDTAAERRHYARCAREVAFYREIAPIRPAPAPRLYHGAADAATGRVVLLLEDLSGARAGDVLAGCSPSEASLVLDAVALFHAGWWGCPLHAVFPWLPRWGGDHRARQERYARQVGPFLQRYGDRLPRAVRAAVERLSGRYAAVLAALDQAPATVIHADLHLDNVLFAPPGTQPPAVVLDWQGVAAGPAAVDVAFFLVGSLAPDQRRATEDDLLRHYHADLASHGLDGYPVERLHHDYRLALLWHLAGTVGWLAGADPNRLVGRERALVAAAIGDGRLIAALLDHDAARLVEAI